MRKHIAWYLKGLRNSARVRDEINKIEGVSCKKPQGAFYIMMNISGIMMNS